MSFQIHNDFTTLIYSTTLALCSYLGYRAFTPPHPTPDQNLVRKDQFGSKTTLYYLQFFKFTVVSSGLLQAFYSVFRPINSSPLCPAPNHVSWDLFEWNQFTTPLALIAVAGGSLRVLAYAQLGGNFTYELARPSGLVTGGLYRYAQHPSYTGALLFTVGMLPLSSRFDAGYGCFTPAALQLPLTAVTWLWIGNNLVLGLSKRIEQEEDMMRQSFGTEWEEYHKRTCRFLPGLI